MHDLRQTDSVLVVMSTAFLAVDFVNVEGVSGRQWLGVARMPRGNGIAAGEPDVVVASDFVQKIAQELVAAWRPHPFGMEL